MSKKKKSSLSGSLAVVLAAIMLIAGGTFAYLTSRTDTVVNNFNGNALGVTLTEESGQEFSIIPGTSQVKDPLVQLNTTVDAYVFVQVEDNTKVQDGAKELVQYTISSEWTKLEGTENVYYQTAKAGEEFSSYVLKDNTVYYSENLTNEDVAMDKVTLSFKALAIQQAGFASVSEAYEALTAFEVKDENGKIVAYNVDSAEDLFNIAEMVGQSFFSWD